AIRSAPRGFVLATRARLQDCVGGFSRLRHWFDGSGGRYSLYLSKKGSFTKRSISNMVFWNCLRATSFLSHPSRGPKIYSAMSICWPQMALLLWSFSREEKRKLRCY